jgi:archaellum biogenesis ATPase FlaH
MEVIVNVDNNFLEYLQRYDINHSVSRNNIIVNDRYNVFEKLVISNDLNQLMKLEKIINTDIIIIYCLDLIWEKGSSEMIKLLLNLINEWNGKKSIIIKAIASRYDDDLELFQYCATLIGFPDIFNDFDIYEKTGISTIYDF